MYIGVQKGWAELKTIIFPFSSPYNYNFSYFQLHQVNPWDEVPWGEGQEDPHQPGDVRVLQTVHERPVEQTPHLQYWVAKEKF